MYKHPNISIVIPTYNEEGDIREGLNSLFKQSYKKFEIIIIDDGSTDNTVSIVKNFIKKDKKVKLFKGEHKGPGFSRNFGAKKAKGAFLIFVDADMTFDRDYIKRLISPLIKNNRVIGSTHELELVKNIQNQWSRCWGKIRISKSDAKNIKIFRAIFKKKFLEMEGFDPKYGYADDQTFWIKYGKKPIVAKGTICYHKNPETLTAVYKQSKWIGASIENFFVNAPYFKYLAPLIMILISPLMIPLLSLKKSIKNKDLKFLIPWMVIFMTVRYFGTMAGIINKIYFRRNIK